MFNLVSTFSGIYFNQFKMSLNFTFLTNGYVSHEINPGQLFDFRSDINNIFL